MAKIDSIIDFSILLNKGFGSKSDCKFFSSVNHPQLIDLFIKYINDHKDLIGLTKIENRQSIADSGCDVFVELKGSVKIGVQIKSQNDVADKAFSNKVKAQYAESFALGLDKFYILICAPMTTSNEKKINYILSNMATYKTNYHALLGPNNCVKIFDNPSLLIEDEFKVTKQLYSEVESRSELAKVISLLQKEVNSSYHVSSAVSNAIKTALNHPRFERLEDAHALFDYLSLSKADEKEDFLDNLNGFISKIEKLSNETRSFYAFLLKQAEEDSTYLDGLVANLHEITSLTSLPTSEVNKQVQILGMAKHSLVTVDDDEPYLVKVNYWSSSDDNITRLIKYYCEERKIDIDKVIVDGQFNLLHAV